MCLILVCGVFFLGGKATDAIGQDKERAIDYLQKSLELVKRLVGEESTQAADIMQKFGLGRPPPHTRTPCSHTHIYIYISKFISIRLIVCRYMYWNWDRNTTEGTPESPFTPHTHNHEPLRD